MNNSDFIKLLGLLSKLTAATEKASREDGTFNRFHSNSILQLKEIPDQLRKLEKGLRTAKILK